MDLQNLANDLSEMLQSENGCPYTDLTDGDFADEVKKKDGQLNILHINIHSFNKNIDNLTYLLSELYDHGIIIHVIGICETSLSDESKQLAQVENYQVVHRCRVRKSGGGVSLLVHDKVKIGHVLDTLFV